MSSPNCTNPPANTPSNAGVAGIGVYNKTINLSPRILWGLHMNPSEDHAPPLRPIPEHRAAYQLLQRQDANAAKVILGFVIPAIIAVALSLSLIIQESFLNAHRPAIGTIRRKLLYGFSDQQILYGIGIQAVGLAQINTLVPYHFFIIWMLALLSMGVHNLTLLVLVNSFRSDTVLRWLRQVLMLVNLVLSCVYGIFMLQVVQKDLETTTLPTTCAWQVEGGKASNVGLSYVGTIAVIAGNCVVFLASTWYLHDRRQKAFKWVQLAGWMVMTAIAVGAVVRVIYTSQAFGQPTTPLSDNGEKQWSFATMVSLLMLALPLMTVLEIYRGEVHVNRDGLEEKA